MTCARKKTYKSCSTWMVSSHRSRHTPWSRRSTRAFLRLTTLSLCQRSRKGSPMESCCILSYLAWPRWTMIIDQRSESLWTMKLQKAASTKSVTSVMIHGARTRLQDIKCLTRMRPLRWTTQACNWSIHQLWPTTMKAKMNRCCLLSIPDTSPLVIKRL